MRIFLKDTKVINSIGTSDDTQYPSWISKYSTITQIDEPLCCICSHSRAADVGAHITYSNNQYIAPMCYDHNNKRGATLALARNTWVVLVSKF
jgi:hypothetical protein